MRKKKPVPLSSRELRSLLRLTYSLPAWVFLEEARNSTGYVSGERYADALAMSMYPSRGIELVGFELKSSRSDVKRELTNPDKADQMQRYCHRWYLVVGRADLVSIDEVPPTWGLMVPFRGGLKTAKAAQTLKPGPWPKTFVASLLRNAFRDAPANRKLADARREAQVRGIEIGEERARAARKVLQQLKEQLWEFEKASGIKLSNEYLGSEQAARQGALFKAAQEVGMERIVGFVSSTADRLEMVAKQLRDSCKQPGR